MRDDGEGRRVAEEVKAGGGGRGGRDADADEVDDESEERNESLCVSDFFSFRHVAAAIVVVNERNLHQERERVRKTKRNRKAEVSYGMVDGGRGGCVLVVFFTRREKGVYFLERERERGSGSKEIRGRISKNRKDLIFGFWASNGHVSP